MQKRFQNCLFLLSCSVGLIPSGSFRTKMQSSVDSDMGRYAETYIVRSALIETQGSQSQEISGFETFGNHSLLVRKLQPLLRSSN